MMGLISQLIPWAFGIVVVFAIVKLVVDQLKKSGAKEEKSKQNEKVITVQEATAKKVREHNEQVNEMSGNSGEESFKQYEEICKNIDREIKKRRGKK